MVLAEALAASALAHGATCRARTRAAGATRAANGATRQHSAHVPRD